MLVARLSTAGVSGGVAQESQMPMGPQMLEDIEEPMLARPATLRDLGTPDQIVMEQHSLTHFPSQPWCKMCVESRGRDLTHRKQWKIDAVVPQLQFDYGCVGDGGPLQIACFLVGADTFWNHPCDDGARLGGAATAEWVRDLVGVLTLLCTWRQRRSSSVATGQRGKRMLSRRTRLAEPSVQWNS